MNKTFKIVFFIGLIGGFFISKDSCAQANLVINGNFENYRQCPLYVTDSNDVVSYADGWKRPTHGKSLYYNKCSPKYTGLSVPANWVGVRMPYQGDGYMGLCAYRAPVPGTDPGFRREYIQTELLHKLKAGRRYYFEMYLSRADSGLLGYAVKNMGAAFTTTAISRNDSNEISVTPQIESAVYITDRVNWTKVSGSFIATGGEKYLTIGRFGPEGIDQVLSINGSQADQAYYYIDDVALIDSCSTFDNVVENILGPDSTFCKYSSFTKSLNATNTQATNYLWKGGAIFPVITISDTGKYWVRMSNTQCVNYDTIIISSNSKPIVDLGPDTTICFNRNIKLQSKNSKSFYTYNWYIFASGLNFGVGNSPTYTATTQDFFIVKVTDFSCSGYDTILVFKSTMDTLILRPDTALCRQAHFLLNATTHDATKYKWNTGDTTATIYTSAREKYWVTVTDGLCSVKDTVKIQLEGPLKPTRDTAACENTLLIISGDPGATSYLWNTGDATRDIAAYNNSTYTITQTKSGCITKDSITVRIDKVPLVNLGNDTNVCIDPLYHLKAVSPYAKKFTWNTGDSTATIQIDSPGIFAVRTENNTCWSGDTIEIHTQLKVPFSFGEDVSDCFNSTIVLTTSPHNLDSFAWSTGVSDSFIVINQPGTYWLKTDKGYCTNIDSITFYAKPRPTVSLRNDTTVCKGTPVAIDAANPDNSVMWNTGDTAHILIKTKPGFYSVKVTNAEHCYSTDSFNLYNFPTPLILDHHKAVICSDSVFRLQANPLLKSFSWSDGSSGNSLVIDKSGKYWVSVIDSYNCVHADTATLISRPRPVILVKEKIETCELNIPLETEASYAHYLWNHSDTSSTYTITRYGAVHLSVIDTNNCRNNTVIMVGNSCPSSVKIPNVFSPNDDGFNDQIIPDYINIVTTDFKIYNRWGQLVFETTNLAEAWNGKDVPVGVYFYVLTCKGTAGESFAQNGSITLVR
ncbi:MAG: gliding motility-associated C-terminal domain-containing protein [Bacteroidota bacterium]